MKFAICKKNKSSLDKTRIFQQSSYRNQSFIYTGYIDRKNIVTIQLDKSSFCFADHLNIPPNLQKISAKRKQKRLQIDSLLFKQIYNFYAINGQINTFAITKEH